LKDAGESVCSIGAGLDFDEEAFAVRDGGEDFFEGGDFFAAPARVFPLTGIEGAESREILARDGTVAPSSFAGVKIVDDDQVVITGKMNVNLDGIGSLLPGKADGGECILRGVERGATMGNDFHGARILRRRRGGERINAKGIRRKDANQDFI
jgi:hypothetical protein